MPKLRPLVGRVVSIIVAPCTLAAARFAVERWHYSRKLPATGFVRYGVWEEGEFIGAVVFGRGSCMNLLRPFGVDTFEGAELIRVALRVHRAPVTQMLSLAIRHLKKTNPGLRILVSYADTAQGHHGGIYQAGSWFYLGEAETTSLRIHGDVVHPRSVSSRYGTSSLSWLRRNVDPRVERVHNPVKYRYAFPLDRRMRRQLSRLALPYPPNPHNAVEPKKSGAREENHQLPGYQKVCGESGHTAESERESIVPSSVQPLIIDTSSPLYNGRESERGFGS